MSSFEEELIRSLRNGSDMPFGAAGKIIVGRKREEKIIEKDIDFVCSGGSALRVFLGDYGTGKTLLGRIALEKGLEKGLLPIYTSELPLHKAIECYQTIINGIITPEFAGDSLFYLLSQWSEKIIMEVENSGIEREKKEEFLKKIDEKILEYELTNDFNMAVNAFVEAHLTGHEPMKKKIVDWMSGRKVSFWELKSVKISRRVESKEESNIFLKDILKLSKAIDYNGVVLVIDELELMQNLRTNISIKGYEALREILDMISSKDLPHLYSIWLGTTQWFENPDRGIKSYLALYDRLKTEISSTTESTVQVLDEVSGEDFDPLFNSVLDIYEKAYSFDLKGKIDENSKSAIKVRLTSPFHNNNFVEMRQAVKSLVEFFDTLKDGTGLQEALSLFSSKDKEDNAESTAQFWT